MVETIIEFFIVFGVALSQYPSVWSIAHIFKSRSFARRNLKKYTQGKHYVKKGPINNYINKAIEVAGFSKWFSDANSFFRLMGLLFVGIFFITNMIVPINIAILGGIMSSLVPLIILNGRLYNLRISRSKEGKNLVQDILNNYKIYDYNIKESILITASEMEKGVSSKGVLLNLSKGLNYAVTRDEIKDCLEIFRFSFDTSWADILAADIFFACTDGIRIDYAMEDLLKSMIAGNKITEHEKRENNEARLMLKYLAPASYLLSIGCACTFFDYTPLRFFRYQFLTATGLQWFIIMTIFYGSGIVINMFLSNGKMDI